MNGLAVHPTVSGRVRGWLVSTARYNAMRPGAVRRWALGLLLLPFWLTAASAADPLVVVSVQSSGGTTVCDTNCIVCTVGSGECITVDEEDLILCKPLSSGLPISSCDWSLFMQGDAPALQINTQLRAAEVANNGNIAFVALTDTTVPGIGAVESDDIIVFSPDDLLKPFVGGGPYDDGTLKLYLNGDLSQSIATAKPWDAIELLPDGTCENAISATTSAPHSCTIIGSLSGGTPGSGLDGVHGNDEDLLRCIPSGFAPNGTVESCDFAMFFDASKLNGGGASALNSEIKAIDFLSFTPSTMTGSFAFRKGSGNPTGFPPHDPGKDLLFYSGTFGAGNCVPSGNPCANLADCLVTDTACNTGTCSLTPLVTCAVDEDCSGSGNDCNSTRVPTGTITKYFDGVAVGLTGSGQNIEAFAILSEGDGDGIPDGIDNCPGIGNPPTVCDGAGPETCPLGLSSQCPSGENCVQADSDIDGVGDECDQCNGRDDAVCFCGDAILDIPSEQCDLGSTNNGQPGSPCSATCTISGTCKGSGTPCTTAAECPSGQGCCGNNITEGNEACDDGNVINNDVCTTTCDANAVGTEIIGCDNLTGPNVLPAFLKITKFRDTSDVADIDRWKTKGEAIFTQGLTIDPDTQSVTITYNNTPSGVLFTSQLDTFDCPQIPCFLQSGTLIKPKWKFLHKPADLAGAPSWRKGKFSIKSNKVKFTLDGRNEPLFTSAEAGSPPTMRQTIRVGDVCITAVISCEVKSGGKTLKCASVP